ncbi:hypothetical protein C8R44DRAFT_814333 [Mycena epipterygia]|nr:hypothetical protein C8R44DRAFT_814333 [Mycena epipterygia]
MSIIEHSLALAMKTILFLAGSAFVVLSLMAICFATACYAVQAMGYLDDLKWHLELGSRRMFERLIDIRTELKTLEETVWMDSPMDDAWKAKSQERLRVLVELNDARGVQIETMRSEDNRRFSFAPAQLKSMLKASGVRWNWRCYWEIREMKRDLAVLKVKVRKVNKATSGRKVV